MALFYSPTILRVGKVCLNISKSLCNTDHPTSNAQDIRAWSSPLPSPPHPTPPSHPMDWPSRLFRPAVAQAPAVDQSAGGKPSVAPSLCKVYVCVCMCSVFVYVGRPHRHDATRGQSWTWSPQSLRWKTAHGCWKWTPLGAAAEKER